PRRHRQDVDDVPAVDLEPRMRRVLDLQEQVASLAALAREPDRLPGLHALGDADFQGLAVDADAHAVAAIDGFQRYREARAGVAVRLRATPEARPRPARRAAPAAEQFLEEVAEAAPRTAAGEDLVEVEAATGTRPAEAPGRRAHLV